MTVVFNSITQAQRTAGMVVDRNSKMPGSTWSLSIQHCQVGGKLRNIKGSVCEHCYVAQTERRYANVVTSWDNNLARFDELDIGTWADAMAVQIRGIAKKRKEAFHRWFAAGDLQSSRMMAAIARVCELTPEIRHWLPTREVGHIKEWKRNGGRKPRNLVIRVSSTMINDKPRSGHEHTSTVHSKGLPHIGHACPSTSEKHRRLDAKHRPNCGPCRACWNPRVKNVSYLMHG